MDLKTKTRAQFEIDLLALSLNTKFNPNSTERPDPPSALQVIEIGSRSIKLSWNKAFDGNSPIREYIIQYQPVSHGILEDDWEPSKTHNISHTPGSLYSHGSNPSQNGNKIRFLSNLLFFSLAFKKHCIL